MSTWKRIITTADNTNYKNSNVKSTDINASVSSDEFGYLSSVTSDIQTQINGKQASDSELTELATMASTTASALADLTGTEVQILDGATLSTTELNLLDGITTLSGSNTGDQVLPTRDSLGIDTDDAVTFGNLTVSNLTVNGTTTTVNSETISLDDNTILLNANATGSASADAGLVVERGSDSNQAFFWDEDATGEGGGRWSAGSSETGTAGATTFSKNYGWVATIETGGSDPSDGGQGNMGAGQGSFFLNTESGQMFLRTA